MSYTAKQIDDMRSVVSRIVHTEGMGYSYRASERRADIERRLLTYISQDVTLDDLTARLAEVSQRAEKQLRHEQAERKRTAAIAYERPPTPPRHWWLGLGDLRTRS